MKAIKKHKKSGLQIDRLPKEKKLHSSFYKDIRIIQIAIGVLTLLLITSGAYLQFFTAEQIKNRPFIDTQSKKMMDRLVAQGAIFLDDADRISLDESSPALRSISKYRVSRVRSLLPFMEIRHGRPCLPESVVSTHYRATDSLIKSRGAILDRNGQPLAEGPLHHRRYPLKAVGFPVIGAAHSVYSMIGLEKHLNSFLTNSGSTASSNRLFKTRKASAIDHIVLTIDASLQQAVYDAMEGYTGAAIVLDVSTGDILAAVSTPAFDPSDTSLENWRRLQDTDLAMNRCWNRRYPPGSTFKIVTAAALLESDVVDGNFFYTCSGRHADAKVNEFRRTAHGRMDVSSAIRVSCNVFFCEAALRLKSELKTVAERMGFNREPALLPPQISARFSPLNVIQPRIYEQDERVTARDPKTGRIYLRERYTAYTHKDYARNYGTTGRTGFGQGTVETTPLQMAMVASVIATNGILREPNLIAGVWTENLENNSLQKDSNFGKSVDDMSHDLKNTIIPCDRWPEQRVISTKTANRISAAMESVMTTGTGGSLPRLYHHPSDGLILRDHAPWDQCIRIAGKTGTAEVERRQDHSWFISFAPVDEPRYAMAVICEHAGLGGQHAGPVAMKIYAHLFARQ